MLPRPSTQLRDAFRKRFQPYSLEEVEIPALMGDPSGVVAVPNPGNDPTLRQSVYVSVNGVTMIAFNDQVPNTAGLAVMVTRHPNNPQMLIVRRVRDVEDMPFATNVNRHAKSHIYMHADGGDDVVWVDLRQYLPLRVSIFSGMTIHIYRAVFRTTGGWTVVGGVTYDTTSHIPGSGQARYLLVSVSGSGVLTYTNGTPITGARSALLLADVPAVPAGNSPLAAIALESGQSALVESRTQTDIIDLRAASSGGGSSSGSSGTPGGVGFFGGDTLLTDDAANLFFDDTTDTLYIGDDAPYNGLAPSASNKLEISGGDGLPTFLSLVSRVTTASSGPLIRGARARGTRASPTAVQDGDYLLTLLASGYESNWVAGAASGYFVFRANDNFTPSARGIRFEIYLPPKGTTTAQRVLGIDKVLLADSMVRTDASGNLASGLAADVEEYMRFMG